MEEEKKRETIIGVRDSLFVIRDWGLGDGRLGIGDWRSDIGYWGLGVGCLAAVVAEMVLFAEAWEASTVYYSTKVRFFDRVAEILILVCRDLGFDRWVFGG